MEQGLFMQVIPYKELVTVVEKGSVGVYNVQGDKLTSACHHLITDRKNV